MNSYPDDDPLHSVAEFAKAASLAELGEQARQAGDLNEAEHMLRHALSQFRQNMPPDDQRLASVLSNLGLCLKERGLRNRDTKALSEAEALYTEALAIDEQHEFPHGEMVSIRLNNRGLLYLNTGRVAEALRDLERALQIARAHFSHGPHPTVALRCNNLAEACQAAGRLDDAENYFREALEIDIQARGPDDPKVSLRTLQLTGFLKTYGRPMPPDMEISRLSAFGQAMSSGQFARHVERDLSNYPVTPDGLYDAAMVPVERHSFQMRRTHELFPPVFFVLTTVAGFLIFQFFAGGPKAQAELSKQENWIIIGGFGLILVAGIIGVWRKSRQWQGTRTLADVLRPRAGFGAEFRLTRVSYAEKEAKLDLEFTLTKGKLGRDLDEWARLALPYIVLKTVPFAIAQVKGARCIPIGQHPMSVIGGGKGWIVHFPTYLFSLRGKTSVALDFKPSDFLQVCSPRSEWRGSTLLVRFVPLPCEVEDGNRLEGCEAVTALAYGFLPWRRQPIRC